MLEQIGYELFDNWQLKLPEDAKQEIRSMVFREFEQYLEDKVKEFGEQLESNQVNILAELEKKYVDGQAKSIIDQNNGYSPSLEGHVE